MQVCDVVLVVVNHHWLRVKLLISSILRWHHFNFLVTVQGCTWSGVPPYHPHCHHIVLLFSDNHQVETTVPVKVCRHSPRNISLWSVALQGGVRPGNEERRIITRADHLLLGGKQHGHHLLVVLQHHHVCQLVRVKVAKGSRYEGSIL